MIFDEIMSKKKGLSLKSAEFRQIKLKSGSTARILCRFKSIDDFLPKIFLIGVN
jgi:hypothetical protein